MYRSIRAQLVFCSADWKAAQTCEKDIRGGGHDNVFFGNAFCHIGTRLYTWNLAVFLDSNWISPLPQWDREMVKDVVVQTVGIRN